MGHAEVASGVGVMVEPAVTHWQQDTSFSESVAVAQLETENLSHYKWSNGPHVQYAVHTHSYHKVIYCIQGDIVFTLPNSESEIALYKGDRLDLPAHTPHGAIVGANGVTCLEGHRP